MKDEGLVSRPCIGGLTLNLESVPPLYRLIPLRPERTQNILKAAVALAGRCACHQDQGSARRGPKWSVHRYTTGGRGRGV